MSNIILAEKPIAGKKMESVLDVPAVPAKGHLLELKAKSRKWTPPYFDLQWVPRITTTGDFTKIISHLIKADKIYIGTDYDAEGQLIAYNLLKEADIAPSSVYRMKFSSLEPEALKTAFKNAIPFDVNMALCAEVRHYLDWYFGQNISKALTLRLKENQEKTRYYLTPVGRVQTPVLYILVDKEKAINKFIPKDEWVMSLKGVYDDNKIFSIINFAFDTEGDLKRYANKLDSSWIDHIATTEYKTETYPPNKDYVVKECLAQGVSAHVIDFILQDLYQTGYISYPRTTSEQYKIHGVDTQKYLKRLTAVIPLAKKAIGKEPREGKEIGAHPAIYPIEPYPDKDLKGVVWTIIAETFVKSHLPPEKHTITKTYVNINGEIKPAHDNPDLKKDDEFDFVYSVSKRKTLPPERLNSQKIYEWMVKKDIGTVDTRTQTVTKLITRQYTYETKAGLYTSSRGILICDLLAKLYPEITSVSLTRRFEKMIASVRNGAKVEPILAEGRRTVTDIVKKIKEYSE